MLWLIVILALFTVYGCGRGAIGDAASCVYNCNVLRVALPEQLAARSLK